MSFILPFFSEIVSGRLKAQQLLVRILISSYESSLWVETSVLGKVNKDTLLHLKQLLLLFAQDF